MPLWYAPFASLDMRVAPAPFGGVGLSTSASLIQGSNLWPSAYKAGALPAELMRRDLPTYQPGLENPGVLVSGKEPLVTPCVGRVPVTGFEPARLARRSTLLPHGLVCGEGYYLVFALCFIVFLAPAFPQPLIILMAYVT